MSDALVLGGGITGLAAAWALRRAGRRPLVIEAGPRPGGMIRTIHERGYRVELGPQSVQETPEVAALCTVAGLRSEVTAAAGAAKDRYLVRRGGLVPLPRTPQALVTSGALSARAKLQILREPFRSRGPGPEESVADFFRRRLGSEVASTLADAVVLGIYGGDPAELAVGAAFPLLYRVEAEHGSVLKGLRRGALGPPPRLIGFRGGLSRLAEVLAAGCELRTGTRVVAVERRERRFDVRIRDEGGGEETLSTRRLVSALPAPEAARLLRGLGDTEPFLAVPHAPLAVLALGLSREDVTHPLEGFGFLAPHREGRRLLGCIFASSLFPDCAPPGKVLLTAMVGGRRRPDAVELGDWELESLVREELAELLDVRGEPELVVVRRWVPGVPQPTAAVFGARQAAHALEAAHPGLSLLGQWLRGVGIPECVRAARTVEGRSSESGEHRRQGAAGL